MGVLQAIVVLIDFQRVTTLHMFVRKGLRIELSRARIEMIEFNNRDWYELSNFGLRLD